ncbi:hypothetical protein EHYA_09622 [Embleya hyalina]|uniref:Uncharacterized protein n=1 Tax=Embleya hyalina TaxID=516124 RepID=A0A401Z4T6_9ACTN|nr:hypothetical protein EHYA_09622 [Embleya hyalina]
MSVVPGAGEGEVVLGAVGGVGPAHAESGQGADAVGGEVAGGFEGALVSDPPAEVESVVVDVVAVDVEVAVAGVVEGGGVQAAEP